MGASGNKPMDHAEAPDLDALDASWGDEQGDEDDDVSTPPEHDEALHALEAGWEEPKRHKTGAERAAARRDKARKRAERQKERAALARAKQKPKQRAAPSTSTRSSGAPAITSRDDAPPEDEVEERPRPAPKKKGRARKHEPSRSVRRDWQKMALIVGVVIAAGAAAIWLFAK